MLGVHGKELLTTVDAGSGIGIDNSELFTIMIGGVRRFGTTIVLTNIYSVGMEYILKVSMQILCIWLV